MRRSRRRSLVERILLPLFFVRPYRCKDCHTRLYGFGFRKVRREVSSALLAVMLLGAVLSFLVGSVFLFLLLVAHMRM